jgi:hypothetical protein
LLDRLFACHKCCLGNCDRGCGSKCGCDNGCGARAKCGCDNGCATKGCDAGCATKCGAPAPKCGCDAGCAAKAPTCGCDGGGAHVPAPAVEQKPMPPAPVVDPSAFLHTRRPVVQASSFVR